MSKKPEKQQTKKSFHDEEVLGKAYDSVIMKRLLAYLKPYKLLVVVSILMLLFNSFLQIYLSILVKEGIDDYMLVGDGSGLQLIALKYVGIIIAVFFITFGQVFATAWLGQNVQHDIRTRLFGHLQYLNLGFFDKNPVGRLVTRATNDVNTLNEMFSSGVVAIFGDIFMLVFIVAALFYLNWFLALITLVTLPLLIFVTAKFRAKARDAYRMMRIKLARLNSYVQEYVTGMSVVQLFTREEKTAKEFEEINSALRKEHHRSVFYYAVFYPSIEIIGAISIGLLLGFGGFEINSSKMTFGELVAFITLVEMFFRPIRDLSEKYNILQASMASAERIFDLLDTDPKIKNIDKPQTITDFKGKIEFKNLKFAYNDDNWVLNDVSFTVEPGEKVAIVGATGAGKTSLVSLLYRFYDYQSGTIKIDGIELKNLELKALRSRLGLVMQDVFIFEGDYASNVRLRDDSITDEQVNAALTKVGYDKILAKLPEGLKTPIKERGATISTGQKQLLSFARALAFDPDILILDEATSSVDSETELLIQKALEVLLKERTSIIIAHRLSTIEKADKIIVLHHGEVREIGTHQDLLKKQGIYYKLYNLQFKNQQKTSSTSSVASGASINAVRKNLN